MKSRKEGDFLSTFQQLRSSVQHFNFLAKFFARNYSAALAPDATPRPNELTSLPMPLMVLQPVMKVTTIAMREIDKISFFMGYI